MKVFSASSFPSIIVKFDLVQIERENVATFFAALFLPHFLPLFQTDEKGEFPCVKRRKSQTQKQKRGSRKKSADISVKTCRGGETKMDGPVPSTSIFFFSRPSVSSFLSPSAGEKDQTSFLSLSAGNKGKGKRMDDGRAAKERDNKCPIFLSSSLEEISFSSFLCAFYLAFNI